MPESIIADPDTDDHVEERISSCLNINSPRSFFLYAGAGSGKTRSLVNAVRYILDNHSRELMLRGQSIAVITYTNAAADEVARRLDYNRLVSVSTIHSFAWALIRPFQDDIRNQLGIRLARSVQDLEAKSSRPGTKAEDTRLYNLEKTKKRIELLDSIVQFTYSPTGTNRGRDSLDHAEVIALTASMLETYPRLSRILTTRHPFLFVDESQDTNSDLLNSFLTVQKQSQGVFCLGLFGDTMQRIYNDGKQNLEGSLGDEWDKPAKQMNHRSAHRIVRLANSIRSQVDAHAQLARPDRPIGSVRLFLMPTSMDTVTAETHVLESMARVTKDDSWISSMGGLVDSASGVKKLILEHHMAASRLGFGEFFDALGELDSNRTSVLEGTHPEVSMFTRDVIPLIEAARSDDEYALVAILRAQSPLLSPDSLREVSNREHALSQYLAGIRSTISDLLALWEDDQDPKLLAVASLIQDAGLFALPDAVVRALAFLDASDGDAEDDSQPWVRILKCSYSEAVSYARYVGGQTEYATQQGVKGLEFPRVMAIISDDEARGFLFSYEKLFGAKAPTDADRRNEAQGKETSLDRTRRLFYVTCTRAISSLAVVAFTSDPAAVATYVSGQDWFAEDEVEVLDPASI
ncbi:ATP-dependent helicase [Kocuria rhizophila]|uniref:UvrD-helicase domain-containing protein n=1 Tax=Kocuria rhizophila TaxID=72000 RepID=UPI001DB098DF|nr:UvrD-helicase domain-containing protein [Kocuria rhizophila]MCC5675481.1 ATP-dependent helicase [Kocuria rhizophila]